MLPGQQPIPVGEPFYISGGGGGGGRGVRGLDGAPGPAGAPGPTPIAPIQTTDATPTTIFTVALDDPSTAIYQVWINARKTDGSKRARFIRTISAHREGGGVIVESPQADYTNANNPVGMAVTFVGVGNNLEVQVTGLAGETFDWNGGVTQVTLP